MREKAPSAVREEDRERYELCVLCDNSKKKDIYQKIINGKSQSIHHTNVLYKQPSNPINFHQPKVR